MAFGGLAFGGLGPLDSHDNFGGPNFFGEFCSIYLGFFFSIFWFSCFRGGSSVLVVKGGVVYNSVGNHPIAIGEFEP